MVEARRLRCRGYLNKDGRGLFLVDAAAEKGGALETRRAGRSSKCCEDEYCLPESSLSAAQLDNEALLGDGLAPDRCLLQLEA